MTNHLTANDIVHLNERTIRTHGGTFTPPENLADEEALATLTDLAATPEFPTLADKAALYFYTIITQQLFRDANERTALLAARMVVLLNGGSFHKKLKKVTVEERDIPGTGQGTDIWTALTKEVSTATISQPDLREWFARNTTPPKNPE
jgi:death-on-curing protein